MNESILKNIAFLVSIAANIFFIAFLLGKFSQAPFMPPPIMERGSMMRFGGPTAGPMPSIRRDQAAQGPGKTFMMKDKKMPPFPPMIRPEDVFSPEEMAGKFSEMQSTFSQIEKLRLGFADQLENKGVTKEDVLKHFADVDKILNAVRVNIQKESADKISAMSREERKSLAQRLRGRPQH